MTHTRRDFLKSSATATAGIGALGLLSGCEKSPQRKVKEIGLQVYTVREELAKDWDGTLRTIAEVGYDTVEMTNYYGESPEWFRHFLDELGLKNNSGGGAMADLEKDFQKIVDLSLKMGRKYVVCFWPWSETCTADTPDVWNRIADQLNEFGKICQENGLAFAYHNHDLEFVKTGEQIPYDILLKNTDPAVVNMEVDIYWMKKGGYEVIDYFEKYPGRFPLWHVKDMNNLDEKLFECVGEGIIDFPTIFARAELAGLQHIFVEQDQPKDAIECIRVSHDYLRRMRY